MHKSIFMILVLQFLIPNMAKANDGAAEVAIGGIRLKQENRIVMVKERLFISKKKVRVEYEFLNDSLKDVVTEIAFPIPDYRHDFAYGWAPFDDFKVWVQGKELPYKTEARAFLGTKEITDLLTNYGIHIATFGDFEEGTSFPDQSETPAKSQMSQLSKDVIGRLIKLKAIEAPGKFLVDRYRPLWTVKKTYHWTQHFPAGIPLHIAHEYTPTLGMANQLSFSDLEKPLPKMLNRTADSGCPDIVLKESLQKAVINRIKHESADEAMSHPSFSGEWVRYILTTANTWKTPIHDFELVIDREPGEFITFCWDGPVKKIGANTFRAQVKDFIPSKELTVYFLKP